jgi:hypothetical protein
MGTNFYHYRQKPCPICGRNYDPRHIGKSSAGWTFSLHVYPDEEINGLDDWIELWDNDESEIRDEYGEVVPVPEMLDRITRRSNAPLHKWTVADFIDNHAEPGPNGLARHRVDGHHCIGHGTGTWDIMVGEFS